MDLALVLRLFERASPVYGRAKSQKTVFLAESTTKENWGITVPHYTFIRYRKGPFSQQLWNDCDQLCHGGFLQYTDPGYIVTDRGHVITSILSAALAKHDENGELLAAIDEQAAWCAGKTGAELIEHVYDMVVEPEDFPGKSLSIYDIPADTCIIRGHPDGLAIDDDDLEVLAEQLSVTPQQDREAKKNAERLYATALTNLGVSIADRP